MIRPPSNPRPRPQNISATTRAIPPITEPAVAAAPLVDRAEAGTAAGAGVALGATWGAGPVGVTAWVSVGGLGAAGTPSGWPAVSAADGAAGAGCWAAEVGDGDGVVGGGALVTVNELLPGLAISTENGGFAPAAGALAPLGSGTIARLSRPPVVVPNVVTLKVTDVVSAEIVPV
jgi:hypothetical protein